jgi:uncharacterized membrane protein YqjE
MPPGGEGGGPGLLASARRLVATAVGILQTRLELLSTEAEEHIVRLSRLWLLGTCALLLVMLGLLLATVFVLLLFWDTHRLLAAGLLALAYLAGGLGLAAYVRNEARAQPRLFASSLAELAKDRDGLKGEP